MDAIVIWHRLESSYASYSEGKSKRRMVRRNGTGFRTFAYFAWWKTAFVLRLLRREIMEANGWSLRDLYRTLETPGANRLRDAHVALDTAVRAAYGMSASDDILAFLLNLNLTCAACETVCAPITPPACPSAARLSK